MTNSALAGVFLVISAGAFSGTALLPMKYTGGWKFENTWLLYSICAYLLSPWIVAIVTVPHLADVYASAGTTPCVWTAVFGFGWGLAVVLNGIGVALVGLSLASAILMGSSVAIGSLMPLVIRDPHQLATSAGIAIAALDLVMLAGVLLCAWAGELRGRSAAASGTRAITTRGILICFAAGLLSTLFNIVLAYGEVISKQAVAHGANTLNSANAVWSLAVSAGALPSIVWCAARLSRNHEWNFFRAASLRNSALCVSMALLWITGTIIYGAATGVLGPLGTVVGWPIYMSGIILVSSFWGWLTGEWRGVSGAPATCMLAGICVQIIAIVALGRIQ